MAEPIIFTLLLGNKDQILEEIQNQEAQNKLPIIQLQVNKESHISDKERIFAEILEKSRKEDKTPIFNIQLNSNNVKPIFQVQDLINAQNLNIKTTITFDQYNSLTQNSELEAYWKQVMEKVDHVFFTNEADQNLAIADGIVPKDKTTAITDISLVTSVFNNLVYDREIDHLLSDTIPDKAKLDKIIKNAKNQGGRVIIETWPISTDEATNLITAKFGITSEDQIYGLKLEINEILKDASNAAQNLTKYVSQISAQFQKDLGKAEINPIDFNFNTEKVMKDRPRDIQAEQTTPYEPPKENQPKPPGFFRKVFNYFKDTVTSFKEAIFGKKEESKTQESTNLTAQAEPKPKPTITQEQQVVAAPTQQAPINDQEPWKKLGIPQQMYEESLKAEQQLSKSAITQAQSATVIPPVSQPQQQASKNSPVIGSSQKQQDKPFDMTEQDYKAMMSASASINPRDDFNTNDFKYELSQEDLNNIKKPKYWYTENDIANILTAALDDKKVSIQPAITLKDIDLTEERINFSVEQDRYDKALKEIEQQKNDTYPEGKVKNTMLHDLQVREEKIINNFYDEQKRGIVKEIETIKNEPTSEEKNKKLQQLQETKEKLIDVSDVQQRKQILDELIAKKEIDLDVIYESKKQQKLAAVEATTETVTAILNRGAKDIQENRKECAVIPVEMGGGHWCNLFMTHSKEDNHTFITFNDSFGHPISNILDNIIKKTFKNPASYDLIDEQTKQQDNNYDCGPYSVENAIRKATGQPILTEREALNKGSELRAKHAQLVIDKQQVQQVTSQAKANPMQQSSNKFQNMVSQRKNDSSIRR